jgi:hypothetical protein
MITSAELAETIKAEILELVAAGRIPADVHDFSALHNVVDANCCRQRLRSGWKYRSLTTKILKS